MRHGSSSSQGRGRRHLPRIAAPQDPCGHPCGGCGLPGDRPRVPGRQALPEEERQAYEAQRQHLQRDGRALSGGGDALAYGRRLVEARATTWWCRDGRAHRSFFAYVHELTGLSQDLLSLLMTSSAYRLAGIAAAPGICHGKAWVFAKAELPFAQRRLASAEVEAELERLRVALQQTAVDLGHLQQCTNATGGAVLDAYLLILRDELLLQPLQRRVRQDRQCAEWALHDTLEELQQKFDAVHLEYIRERRSDLACVGDALMRRLLHAPQQRPGFIPADAVVVAQDLTPVDTLHLQRSSVLAFLTARGGRTAHAAILARAFDIPAVVGLSAQVGLVQAGDPLIVDGSTGETILFPTQAELDACRLRAKEEKRRTQRLQGSHAQPAATKDGVLIPLLANIALPGEVPRALELGAEGIGLFRTEFLFLNRSKLPTEEEHYLEARQVLQRMGQRPTTFRTLDLAVDKLPLALRTMMEQAPRGLRSLRLCLREPALFRAQLRGLLRASPHGPLRLMFPMVSGLDELKQAKAVVAECRAQLRHQGYAVAEDIPIGVMVELPSAVMVADQLAQEADFLCLGTNDLMQYSFALDREDEGQEASQPFHPALLRMVQRTTAAARAAGRPVGLCGELAGQPLFTLLLLGLGLDSLSMAPSALPRVKEVIRGVTLAEAQALATQALTLTSQHDIEQLFRQRMRCGANDQDFPAAAPACA